MKFKFIPITESEKQKSKWIRYLLGFYAFSFENKNNRKLNSKFLSVFCFIAIVLFFLFMVLSVYLISYGIHYKLTSKNQTISGVGLVIPSIEKDSIKEIRADQEKIIKGEVIENKRRDLVFIPFFLFIPLIFVIGTLHETGHYLACRKFGLKVDEYGFGALSILCIPLIPMGYVKPNEEELKNTRKYDYLSIISSGVFMNILSGIIFLVLYIFFRTTFLDYLFTFNLSVVLFNVLPLGFLDGGLFVRKLNVKVSYVTSILSIILLALVII